MIKLSQNNSFSRIEGLTTIEFNQLRDLLSYEPEASQTYFSGAYKSHKRYLLDKKGNFPSGLRHIVDKYLSPGEFVTMAWDERIKPEPLQDFPTISLGVTPYEAQTLAVRTARDATRGIVCMPTGSGKSLTMALLTAKLKVKTLIIVPNLELKRQLIESFKQLFNTCDWLTIKNIQDPSLFKDTDYDCLILDEAHHAAAKTYQKLNSKAWKKIFYRFFFTATPGRSQSAEKILMESITGEIVYLLEHADAVSEGFIVPVEAYYYDLPKQAVEGFTWAQVYKELVTDNMARNALIASTIEQLRYAGTSTLCLVKEVNHGRLIANKSRCPFAHGENEDSSTLIQSFSDGRFNALVATTGVAGEGTDTRAAEYVIIAGLGKAKNTFVQQCGRGFRRYLGKTSCKIILFRDSSHKFTLKHFKEQCRILKEEYGIAPVKLDLPK